MSNGRTARRLHWITLCGLPQVTLLVVSLIAGLPGTAAAQDEPQRLAELFAEAWEFELQESPVFATRLGDHRFSDRLSNESVSNQNARQTRRLETQRQWKAIDRSRLDRPEQINYDIFGRLLRDDIAEFNYGAHLMPITNRSGFHVYFPELPSDVPLKTLTDYEHYIARLNGFAKYVEDHIELLAAGIERQIVLPAVVLEGYEEAIVAHIVEDPEKSLLHAPFQKFPEQFESDQRDLLAAAGRDAIQTSVVPGYRRFLTFMQEEYVPACRGSIGAAALPDGRAFYHHRVQRYTTLDLTPEAVHETGHREVSRIKQEMQAVIKEVGFEGSFAEFIEYLRSDPRFYANSAEELQKEVAFVLKKMDGLLPQLFKTLPRTPYGIRTIPDYIAPKTTTAYYQPPSGDGSVAGFYYVNVYNLKSRPLYEIEALSLHEAVPGHHLQIALQQEMAGFPEFRRFAPITAFIEGWGLYAERLGLEVGFYTDPYSNFGRLTYEMWRACRLVVDSGMHYFGWTRQQAIQFMVENTALSVHNIESEVDRYISWPGQALAYKTGEMKIREMRALAEQELGDEFDVREFHDVVVGSGAIPLKVLEDNVRSYIEEKK